MVSNFCQACCLDVRQSPIHEMNPTFELIILNDLNHKFVNRFDRII